MPPIAHSFIDGGADSTSREYLPLTAPLLFSEEFWNFQKINVYPLLRREIASRMEWHGKCLNSSCHWITYPSMTRTSIPSEILTSHGTWSPLLPWRSIRGIIRDIVLISPPPSLIMWQMAVLGTSLVKMAGNFQTSPSCVVVLRFDPRFEPRLEFYFLLTPWIGLCRGRLFDPTAELRPHTTQSVPNPYTRYPSLLRYWAFLTIL